MTNSQAPMQAAEVRVILYSLFVG